MLQLLGSGQMAEAISQSASHHQPDVRGRRRVRHCRPSRHVVLGATVAHSWPLQLLENERLFFSPMLSPSPSLVFLPGLELSILAVQKTFHSHDKYSNGVVGLPSRFFLQGDSSNKS